MCTDPAATFEPENWLLPPIRRSGDPLSSMTPPVRGRSAGSRGRRRGSQRDQGGLATNRPPRSIPPRPAKAMKPRSTRKGPDKLRAGGPARDCERPSSASPTSLPSRGPGPAGPFDTHVSQTLRHLRAALRERPSPLRAHRGGVPAGRHLREDTADARRGRPGGLGLGRSRRRDHDRGGEGRRGLRRLRQTLARRHARDVRRPGHPLRHRVGHEHLPRSRGDVEFFEQLPGRATWWSGTQAALLPPRRDVPGGPLRQRHYMRTRPRAATSRELRHLDRPAQVRGSRLHRLRQPPGEAHDHPGTGSSAPP